MIKLKQGSKAYGFKTISYLGAKLSDNIMKGAHSKDKGDAIILNTKAQKHEVSKAYKKAVQRYDKYICFQKTISRLQMGVICWSNAHWENGANYMAT